MRTNFHLWSGIYRHPLLSPDYDYPPGTRHPSAYPTLVVDVELASWALSLAAHAGGPLLGKPGFHVRFLCFNIGWSKL